MAIPDKLINDVRERADIVEIIDSYVPLKKSGRNFRTLCPFHPEKTPSFFVSPEKQIFHCFGCGEGGNVFHFLMKYQNISFVEAVKQVAGIVGIEIKEEKEDSGSKIFFHLNKLVMEFYARKLNSEKGKKCREYLSSRGIKMETQELFHIGYAAEDWDSLLRFLKGKGYKEELLLKAGLILKAREKNRYYDLFRERVILPIIDQKNNVLGFGGRSLSKAMPKYLNSPETPVYKKGKSLYGISVTFSEIVKKRVAIVVEGYFDMVSLYQAGIRNVVASLGTALTPEGVRFLKKYVDEIIIVYDGDSAGQFASLRGLDIVFESGIKAQAIMLPSGYDPDSFVRKKGKEEFLKLLDSKKGIFDYKLEVLLKMYDRDSLDSRIKIVEEMFSSLNKISNYLLKAEYMKRLAQKVGFEEQVLWNQYNARPKKGYSGRITPDTIMKKGNYIPVEATLVYIMLTKLDLVPELKELLSPQEFITPEVQNLVEKIYKFYPQEDKLKLGNLVNFLSPEERKLISEIMSQDLEFSEDTFDRFLTESVARLKILRIEKYCKFLEKEIKKAQEVADLNKASVLLEELNKIKKNKVEI